MLTRGILSQLRAETSALFLCDIQDRFRPLIYRSETIIQKSALLHSVTKLLDIPAFVTEQYPKAFGHTVPDLKVPEGHPIYEKKQFSMIVPELEQAFMATGRNQVILCGIEGHVCVLQTAMGLVSRGIEVHIVCDAVSSQRSYDRTVALHRLSAAGCQITTTESAIFQLMGGADHPHFKAISAMVKENSSLTNEFATDTVI
eukprot:CAMPEP_0182425894 /NCGR_PEP_ID=MMETSP1167-20130531/12386_1 /TAXON_ID=2988 /ORGANISM="Mallomonas Sp, Strain CCMP3275" /LENGTH=200 /DNA_ID=CAMNT_0024606961 /DNA_START=91 /DNA_END=693 /DNA_ORIENTATION=-